MEYNSQKDQLIISEYGRNVQNLIEYAKTIEEDEKRQVFVEGLVDLMHQMNPSHKNNAEYREKLWRHLFRIANYEINVTPPIGETPSPDSKHFIPSRLEYPENQKRFRHYGLNVKELLKKAQIMEDEEMKAEFLIVIASYMKLAYRTWNQDHYISDEIIKSDIVSMSDGKLSLPDDLTIDISAVVYKKRSKPMQSSHSRHRNRKNVRRRR